MATSLSSKEFESLVRDRERIEAGSPERFRRYVRWYVAKGLLAAPIIVSLVFLLAVAFGVIRAFSVCARLFELGFTLARGLAAGAFAPARPPDGLVVDRARYPELYAFVNDVAKRLGVEAIQDVRLDTKPNAAACFADRPRRDVLLFGIPLLATLTIDEFRSIIAHELGHVGRGHGRFSSRISRVRRAWQMGLDSAGPSRWTRPIDAWLRRYVPRLIADAIVLSRAAEREADAAAKDVAGAEASAMAMAKIALATDRSERAFSDATDEALMEGRDPATAVSSWFDGLAGDADAVAGPYRNALAAAPDPFASHPTVRERFAVLGVDPDGLNPTATAPLADCAGRMILGERFEALAIEVVRQRLHDIAKSIENRRRMLADCVKAEVEFDARDASRPLSLKECDRYAIALWTRGRRSEAIQLLRIGAGESAERRLNLALAMQEMGDPAYLLELRAIEDDPVVGPETWGRLIDAYERTGDREKVNALYDRLNAWRKLEQDADAAALSLTSKAEILPDELDPDQRRAIVDALRKLKGVREAYVVRRRFLGNDRFTRLTLIVVVRWWTPVGRMSARVRDALPVGPRSVYFVTSQPPKFDERVKLAARLDLSGRVSE